MRLSLRPAAALLLAVAVAPAALPALSEADRSTAQGILESMERAIFETYYPRHAVGAEFRTRCQATRKAIAQADNNTAAFVAIADTLRSLDRRITFYPPRPRTPVDYGWKWRIIGDAAYVTQLDRISDATTQGLQLGDRIVSIEGLPVGRRNHQEIRYLFNSLSPRNGLHFERQTPDGQTQVMALAATLRPPRKMRERRMGDIVLIEPIPTQREKVLEKRFEHVAGHIRRVGPVAIWRAVDLHRDTSAVRRALAEIAGCETLIIDLRGEHVTSPSTALSLLDGLFAESFDIGTIKKNGLDEKLRVDGDASKAFKGLLLVLIDADTGGFAEVVAHVLQQRQRAVLVGDRTKGWVVAESRITSARGAIFGFNIASAWVPTGELVLADAAQLHGTGAGPDLQVLPQPVDLATRRDVVLSHALAVVKQPLSPEEAYQLFYEDEDDEDV